MVLSAESSTTFEKAKGQMPHTSCTKYGMLAA